VAKLTMIAAPEPSNRPLSCVASLDPLCRSRRIKHLQRDSSPLRRKDCRAHVLDWSVARNGLPVACPNCPPAGYADIADALLWADTRWGCTTVEQVAVSGVHSSHGQYI